MNLLYMKHLLVGTPVEPMVRAGRGMVDWCRQMRRPELREICREEHRIRQAMRRLIRRDSNCIDVGAHIGSTLAFIRSLAPRGEHWGFEAIAEKAQWLRRKFPEVNIEQVALGDRAGQIAFHQNLSRPGFSGIGERHARKSSHGGTTSDTWKVVTVPMARLDDIIPARYRLDFLKVDVEGAEAAVFRGGRRLLQRCRPAVLFESSPGNAKRGGVSHGELFEVLHDCGYEVFLLKHYLHGDAPLDRRAFEAAHRYPFQAFNYLALHSDARGAMTNV